MAEGPSQEAWSEKIVALVGSDRGRCRITGQWLSDMGCDAQVWDLMERPSLIPSPDLVILTPSDERDVGTFRPWKDKHPAVPVVGVLGEPVWSVLAALVQLPVRAAVVLPAAGDVLLRVLRDACTRPGIEHAVLLIPPSMLLALPSLSDFEPLPELPPLMSTLTAREREILALLDRQLSNEEIAQSLVISPHTVKRHLEHLFRKLGVSSRHDAVRLAHRCGLIKTRRGDSRGLGKTGPSLSGSSLVREPLSRPS